MSYRDLTFYVMSGTGNTLRAATWMADVARAAGCPASVHLFEHPHPEPPDGPEHLVGIGTPTHGFSAPWHVLKYVARMPRRRGTHAIVLATRAGTAVGAVQPPGMSATCTYLLALLLLLRGYRVRGLLSVNMPSNWMSLHWGLHPVTVASILARSRPKVERFIGHVLAGRRQILNPNNGYEAINAALLAPISVVYLLVGRVGLAKMFFANAACTGCGTCEKACPVGGVKLVGEAPGRPFWTTSCESCMRCMAYCPKKAVEASQSWVVLTTVVTVLPLVPLWGWLGTRGALTLGLVGLIGLGLSYLLCVGAYLLFHRALQSPLVMTFFSYTTLTRWYRRYHEPGTKLRMLMPPRIDRPDRRAS